LKPGGKIAINAGKLIVVPVDGSRSAARDILKEAEENAIGTI
jgi:hypothetical protein